MRGDLTRRSLQRPATGDSNLKKPGNVLTCDTSSDNLESGPEPTGEDQWDLGAFLKDGPFETQTEVRESAKEVGVLYKNLAVKGVGAQATFLKTLPEAIIGPFGPDLYRSVSRLVSAWRFGKQPPTRDLLSDFSGAVRDGEMMLVLGRPGSGCSTFLKVIANQRESFARVEGQVSYGGISADEQRKCYRDEVIYNPENDQHLPTLTVWQTLRFALMNKTRKHKAESIPIIIDTLLKMFGISHTKGTLGGNEYVRGVSGGERKRVGIAEASAIKSSVVCWDNATRGLDASTALDYAGEGIYELMDKVLVIEEGRMINQGPAKLARQYFIDLGFHGPDRQTTADFLTSVGDPNECQFQPGKDASTLKTAEELEAAFRQSDLYKPVLAEAEHYTVSFWRQVLACTLREFWLSGVTKPHCTPRSSSWPECSWIAPSLQFRPRCSRSSSTLWPIRTSMVPRWAATPSAAVRTTKPHSAARDPISGEISGWSPLLPSCSFLSRRWPPNSSPLPEVVGGALVFKKTRKARKMVEEETQPADEEKAAKLAGPTWSGSTETLLNETSETADTITRSPSVFTWEDVQYEVPCQSGTKKLLNGINGYVQPQTVGKLSGSMLVDGQPPGVEFQRGTGFCKQMNLHDKTATIREALEFSAVLRQGRHISKREKLDCVDRIIDLLELYDIQDAVISSLGVEQSRIGRQTGTTPLPG
ncbi:uncharacterized protein Z518_06705 [Rhinocladiella mackenziei CBS 650.93]|uniref:ABC transporter domain-containing protein n=1 Tax=Rhinocladiella mackenziei CBS 650.93 TaxID=1442369 RepID=A0A0D2IBF3_9EURO|nr:uncharacterized protein Z518_06705 [Rhinocladiella mackenziei CBS 650.93]KIX03154.1 hypothetical protein Z518_06705 [Rhinocladiella mackenziei CBS 650.93]